MRGYSTACDIALKYQFRVGFEVLYATWNWAGRMIEVAETVLVLDIWEHTSGGKASRWRQRLNVDAEDA